MQKSSGASGELERLLETMEYNESQLNNFSPILNWISKRNGKVESIVQGTCSDSTGAKDEFCIGDKLISICYLDDIKLKYYLEHDEGSSDKKSTLLDEKEKNERLTKFKKLVGELSVELCAAESLATMVPQCQIRDFDQLSWNHQMSRSSVNDVVYNNSCHELSSTVGKKVVLLQLTREGYSLEKILPIFSTAIESDEKFILVMNSRTSADSSCILPIAYLIDAVNKSNIRKWPIDLLLLDRALEISMVKFLQASKKTKPSSVYLWGDLQFWSNIPAQLSSGVVGPSVFGARAHFVLDSLADVQTTVDSIVAEVWSSGVRVNHRIRSVVFVHQPIYERVIDFLQKKMRLLKTSGDLRLKSNDFVKRALLKTGTSIDVKKVQAEGIKIFPDESDFSIPTLLYDVGTSCDIMASSSPSLGHVLFLISYRSSTELLSLANNYGEDNEVFIHSTNLAFIKEIAANIKAQKIWVNSNRRRDFVSSSGPIQNQLLSKLCTNDEAGIEPTKAEKDEFGRSVLAGEKALKAWSSTGAEKRHSSVVEAFLSAVKNESSLEDTDRFRYLSDLMRVAGRMFNEESGFTLTQYKPYGVTALVLLNTEKTSLTATLIPILLTLLKGNVVLVVSVSQSSNPYSDSILNTFSSIFPLAAVQFSQSTNISHAIQLISHLGKVPLLWLIHSGQERPEMNQIPCASFNKVIVSKAASVEKSIGIQAQQLEMVKHIFL